ncbi:glycosyltransferase family 25 protein [Lonepinella sp. MS14437]|uniref:glycosyltransferase family 25 protein n=1 Tax=unclassified Lonepinella TaxID=2642006 RepID=UPI0036DA82FE
MLQKNIPPIFIISLKNSPRREAIAQRFTALNISFQFFDAVYGKTLGKEELSQVDYEFYPKKYLAKKPLTIGEIGCAMSHIKVYQYMVEQHIEQAIIFEDDIIIHHDFTKIISDVLKRVPSRREIVFLDHGKAKSWLFKRKLFENYKLVRYRSPSKTSKRCIIMANAYLLTLNGARKLLDNAYPIRIPADYLTGLLQLNRLNAYGVEPPCIFRGTSESEINKLEDRYN